jgi:hypothetical protein
MNAHARYYRDCVRAALGTFRSKGGEPLGSAKRYLLHGDEAREIADSAWATLEAAGVKTKPRWKPKSPGMQRRLDRSYTDKGLRP